MGEFVAGQHCSDVRPSGASYLFNVGEVPPRVPGEPEKCAGVQPPKLQLPLIDSNCTAHAAKQRRRSPEETTIIQIEVAKRKKAGTIRRSQSARASNCTVVGMKDITVRVCLD